MKKRLKDWLAKKQAVLEGMDPARIYVENVRALLGVNTRVARWLCERGCRDGLLEHWISLENPDRGRSLAEFRFGESMPAGEIVDDVAEQLGEKFRFQATELRQVDFYRGAE